MCKKSAFLYPPRALFRCLTNSAIAATKIGQTLEEIGTELATLDQSGKIIEALDETKTRIFEIGELIKKFEPLVKSKLNMANAKLILKLCAGGGVTVAAAKRLKELSTWRPKLEYLLGQGTMSDPTKTASETISTTTTSTSSSASASETPVRYCVTSKSNTNLDEFKEFIKLLPDRGAGNLVAFPHVTIYSYATLIKPSEKDAVRKLAEKTSFILAVLVDEWEDDVYSVIPRKPGPKLSARAPPPIPNPYLDQYKQDGSPDHLDILSQSEDNARARRLSLTPEARPSIPEYLLDRKAGEGTTIFVIDTGIEPSHPVS